MKKHPEQEEEDHPLYFTKKEPKKSLHTFLRNQNKLYINSFNMVDRKAAIMIKVNATIISGIVIFFKNFSNVSFGTQIGLIMALTSFISLMFAINASRPHIFSLFIRHKKVIEESYPKLEENIFPVGPHADENLFAYEEAYDKIVSSQELQIGNQVRTMYMFEKRLKVSLTQLEISYIVFMFGFCATLFLFVLGNFIL